VSEGARILSLVERVKGSTPLQEQADQLEKFMLRVLEAEYKSILMIGMHEGGRVECWDTADGPGDLAIMHRRIGHLLDEALDGPEGPE